MRKFKTTSIKIVGGILIVLTVVLSLYFTSNSRSFQFFGNIYDTIPNNSNMIALTFDDGPSENVNVIISKLQEHDIPATFFLIGKEMEENPDETQLIVDSGFAIGNHSYSHERMWLKSYSFCEEEVEITTGLIRDSGYTGEIYFRPPYGKKVFMLPYYLMRSEINTIMWNIEPETVLGYNATGEEIASHILDNVESGSIILLHPMYNPDNVLLALDIAVPELKEQGYTFGTIDEMFEDM